MTLEDRVHALRLRLFRRAEELGNVSEACREAGVSRSAYYQLRARFRRYGSEGLHPKFRKARLDASLQSYLRFYNHERAHHGYRTRGRTPAQLVSGAQDANA